MHVVRRTQVYLDDQLRDALQARARRQKTTISELVRQAVRERYLSRRDQQMKAMKEFVGIRKKRSRSLEAVEYVRNLRRGDRLKRLRRRERSHGARTWGRIRLHSYCVPCVFCDHVAGFLAHHIDS